jgi:hypothetical protein
MGSAGEVVALIAIDGRLVGATTRGELVCRDISNVDGTWVHVGTAPIDPELPVGFSDAISGFGLFQNELYAVTTSGALWFTDAATLRPWRRISDTPALMTLAASWFGSVWVLYGAAPDQIMLLNPHGDGAEWKPLGDADQVLAMAGAIFDERMGAVFGATRDGRLVAFDTSRII